MYKKVLALLVLTVCFFTLHTSKLLTYNQLCLLQAAYDGHVPIMQQCFKCGVNVSIRDDQGRTPLSYAAEMGWSEATDLLLKHGANPNLRDDLGITPLDYARENGNEDVVTALYEVDKENFNRASSTTFDNGNGN